MNRRKFLLGVVGVGAIAAAVAEKKQPWNILAKEGQHWVIPTDNGSPYLYVSDPVVSPSKTYGSWIRAKTTNG